MNNFEREQAIRQELDELYAADAEGQIQMGPFCITRRIHILEQELNELRRGAEVTK